VAPTASPAAADADQRRDAAPSELDFDAMMEQTTEGADYMVVRVLQRMYNKPWARLGTPLHAKLIFKGYVKTPECGNRDAQLRLRSELLPSMATKLVCEAPCVAAVIRQTFFTSLRRGQRVQLKRLPGAGGMGAAARVRLGAAFGGARQPLVVQREAYHDHLGQCERVP